MRPDPEAHRPPAAALHLRNLSMAVRLNAARELLIAQQDGLENGLVMRIGIGSLDDAILALVRPAIARELAARIAEIDRELAMIGVVAD